MELRRESEGKVWSIVGKAGRKFGGAEANCKKLKDAVGIVMSLDQTGYIYITLDKFLHQVKYVYNQVLRLDEIDLRILQEAGNAQLPS